MDGEVVGQNPFLGSKRSPCFGIWKAPSKNMYAKNTKWNSRMCACSIAQSCPSLWDPMDCRLPGSSVLGISQGRILEWVAISSSRQSSQTRVQTHIFSLAGGFFTTASPKVSEMTYVTSLIWKTAVIWIRQTYMYPHRNILSMYWLLRKKIKQNVICDMLTIAQYVYGNGYVNS